MKTSALNRRERLPVPPRSRRGVITVMAAMMMVVIFAFVAFTVDLGYLAVMKTELQATADASALASVQELGIGIPEARQMAKDLAAANRVANVGVTLQDSDIEFGIFDEATRTFTVNNAAANAVRVTARKIDYPTFFGPVINQHRMSAQAEAIAMMNPRDIAFVVDLSGSMNDDTEPCWATEVIDDLLSSEGFPTAGSDLMVDLYQDLGFGSYPGTIEYLGAPLGVPSDSYAYALMTVDDGPLTQRAISSAYRISNDDDERIRKQKAYSWMIDNQIARVMPNADPPADSGTHYGYWEKYLDYVIQARAVGENPPSPPSSGGGGGGGGGGGTPSPPPPPSPPIGQLRLPDWTRSLAAVDYSLIRGLITGQMTVQTASAPLGTPRQGRTTRVTVPASQDGDRIDDFNNPNRFAFPSARSSLPRQWRNQIGYITYTQFLLDWGRDRSPEYSNSTNADERLDGKVPLSRLSPYCRYHREATAGGTFSFPPRTQPMHAVRRSLIAAIEVVRQMNSGLTMGAGDRVSIITYDGLDSYHQPEIAQTLTGDYQLAMQACTRLQATSDIGRTTAMEAGIALARDHLKPVSEGGSGRRFSSKVIVLLTDGIPNAWQTPDAEISQYIVDNPSPEFYDPLYPWLNSVLMQTAEFYNEDGMLFPVGMGLGTDYDFMDRIARTGLTDDNGRSARGSGNPTEYEQRLTDIFTEIIRRPSSRLVD